MPFDLLKLTPVINHLNTISPKMYRKLSNEIQIHCPFCDDAIRRNAANHGHLYLSIDMPVFNCFRCNTSGTLIGLLIQTGFTDREVLEFIGQFIKINFTKDYYKIRDYKDLTATNNELKQKILNLNLNFKKHNYNSFIDYKNYLNKRIGDVNYLDFLIFPNIYQNFLTIHFNNYIGENILLRYVNNPQKRYLNNNKTSGLYYFQKLDLNNTYKKVTLCEGVFDIINLYLYNDILKNNLFIAIRGKNFIGTIEKLLLEYMLLDYYELNIIFDNDYVKNSKKNLKYIDNLIKIYNGKIQLNGYKPILNTINDVGDFPGIEKI